MTLFHRLIISIFIGFSTRQCINPITFYSFLSATANQTMQYSNEIERKKNTPTENGNNFGSFIILWWVFILCISTFLTLVTLNIKQTYTWWNTAHITCVMCQLTLNRSFNLFRMIQCISFQYYLNDNADGRIHKIARNVWHSNIKTTSV